VLVDAETGTVAYYGAAARRLLAETGEFPHETQVIVPAGSQVRVEVGGEGCLFGEPGALAIPPGSRARVEVLQGEVMVVTCPRPPGWYRKHLPRGEHAGRYQEISRLNRLLAEHPSTRRENLSPDLLAALLERGLVREEAGLPGRVVWQELRSFEDLRLRLQGLPEPQVAQAEEQWSAAMRRRFQARNAGRFPRADLGEADARRLIQAGLVREVQSVPDELFWARMFTEEEVRGRLAGAGYQGQDVERLAGLWAATSRAGYDISGLTWEKGGLALYLQRDRMNLWNEQPTEWLLASTNYGSAGPATLGCSTVRAPEPLTGPVPFTRLRPAETLHRHPVVEGEQKQTEVYLVTRGRGALLSLVEGRPVLSLLHAGDMAVLEPGVVHCVLAVDGDYEQLVVQVPSAFQYGFRFKENRSFEDLPAGYEELLSRARQELARGTRGIVEVVLPRAPAPPGAPETADRGAAVLPRAPRPGGPPETADRGAAVLPRAPWPGGPPETADRGAAVLPRAPWPGGPPETPGGRQAVLPPPGPGGAGEMAAGVQAVPVPPPTLLTEGL
jgi:hypothetical protein